MVRLTSEKLPDTRNLVLGATELDRLKGEAFDGIIAIHLIQHLNKSLIKQFLQQVHDLLTDEGKFLLVFTNNCYTKNGYQPEGSKDGLNIVWYKHGLEDIVPLLNKAHLKPLYFWMQETFANTCGTKCPFAFICQKS